MIEGEVDFYDDGDKYPEPDKGNDGGSSTYSREDLGGYETRSGK